MKKKELFIFILVLTMLFSFVFKPLTVKADETDNENETQEVEKEQEDIKEEILDETITNEEEPSNGETEGGIVEEKKEVAPVTEEKVEEQVDETKKDEVSNEEPTRKAPATDETEKEEEEPVEEPTREVPTTEEVEEPVTINAAPETDNDVQGGKIYDIQKVLVNIRKLDNETKEDLAGATLQLFDSKGNLIDEWVSDGKAHVIELSDGIYTLHEKEAPEGYDLAEDKEFTVKVEIYELDAGADFSDFPCPDYGGTPLYYVEFNGEKHEVYCINQNWETPDDISQYDGEILNANSIRDFTKQTVPVDISSEKVSVAIMSDGPMDISDQTLSDDELYNKILDIIYHRHKAKSVLGKQGYSFTDEEIRSITEVALKNYTNAGIAERQYGVNLRLASNQGLIEAFDAAGVIYKRYTSGSNLVENPNGNYVSYIKHNYRDYVYVPDAPLGEDIFRTDFGKGNSFGQMIAGHYNHAERCEEDENGNCKKDANGRNIMIVSHDARSTQADRDQVARYYQLFLYLISEDDPHPEGMNLYIYSSNTVPTDLSGNDNDARYQNLLGVTGYFEEFEQQEMDVVLENNYSTEKVSVTIKKVWEDGNNENGKRPTSIEVKLSNGETVTLDESNNWEATITGLPKYDKGKLITYSWEEINAPENYQLTSTETKDYVTTITNTEIRNITVSKIWWDNDNEYKVRVDEVTVDVIANGEVIKTLTLNEDNEWSDTLYELPVYENGEKIKYEVSEQEVKYYAVEIEENEEGFVINNFYDAQGEGEPPHNPKTGDNILLYVVMLITSFSILTTCTFIKKYN